MNKFKQVSALLFIAVSLLTTVSSCKKGDDDPAVSVYSRKDRFTNTWTLVKYEKNGTVQDIGGTTHIYNVFNNGTLNQTIEGSIFGFPTREENAGTWSFLNDDEDVKITIKNNATIFNIQRLATKELWLKTTSGADVHVYFFDGL